jgi:hypothetical protein
MRQSRSSVLPKTGDGETRKAQSLLAPRLMAAAGMLGLVASFGLMAAFAPAHARIQGPSAPARAGCLVSASLVQQLSAASVRVELNKAGLAPGGPVPGGGATRQG